MHEVPIAPACLRRMTEAVGSDRKRELDESIASCRVLLDGRTVWNINSTAVGGGVAEMLQPLIAYARALGVDVRWLVIDGDPAFFEITKRLHNHLHGYSGDGGLLAEPERVHYEAVTADNARRVLERVRPGDVVICHDPQTAGMVSALARHGAAVIWRCHIGHDRPNALAANAWSFLAPFLATADAYVFTRRAFVPPQLDGSKVTIIPPSIDPASPKNQPMSAATARSILVRTGLLEGPLNGVEPCFTREDGTVGRVERFVDVVRLGPAPSPDQRLVVQVSRWDHLKDPIGVLRGFAHYLAGDSASLVLAGPNVSAVADDPEGGRVLDEVFTAWRALPHEVRHKVHLTCLPMADREENAAIVNALQRHAAVIVQKSLQEGFGLTVTEAMWKGRPVIASAVGGIQDQIEDGTHGLLLQDPSDLSAFARSVERVLADDAFADRLAQNARRHVEERFLFVRHLRQYASLFEQVLSARAASAA